MRSHPEVQGAFHAGLFGVGLPVGITAVGDIDRRFAVYRNTVVHSLTQALGQRFPTVQRIVGPAFFAAMARVFVQAHPPRSPVLQEYGVAFPDFLAGFPPAGALTYLPDVARLEVLRGQAYHAADATPLSPTAFARDLGRWGEAASVAMHPSMRVLSSVHPVVSIWAMNQPGATLVPLPAMAETALVFRRDGEAAVARIDAADGRVVMALADGQPIGVASAAMTPDGAAALMALLLHNGLIAGLPPHHAGESHD